MRKIEKRNPHGVFTVGKQTPKPRMDNVRARFMQHATSNVAGRLVVNKPRNNDDEHSS